jgi:hypothetical protein
MAVCCASTPYAWRRATGARASPQSAGAGGGGGAGAAPRAPALQRAGACGRCTLGGGRARRLTRRRRLRGLRLHPCRLLQSYLTYVQATSPGIKEVRLICKEEMVPLYEGAGFTLVGPSPVVHGQDPWLEFACALGDGDAAGSGGGEAA